MISEVQKSAAKASSSAGMGLIGWLIVLGCLGLGPCADDCSGCGPTIQDVAKQIQQQKVINNDK